MSRLGRRSMVAAFGLLALTGCSVPPSSSVGQQAGPTVPAGTSPNGASGAGSVLDEISATEGKVREVVARLTESCLRKKGIANFPPQGSTGSQTIVAEPSVSPGLADAKERGYGIAGGPAPSGSMEPVPQPTYRFASPDEERRFFEALTGSSGGAHAAPTGGSPKLGGCIGEARTAVYGQAQALQNPVVKVNEAAHAAFDANSSLKGKFVVWSQCLQKGGYPQLVDPEDAQRYAQYFSRPVGSKPGGPVPKGGPYPVDVGRQKEIAFAVVDAQCADQGGLREAQRQAWTTALSAALDQFRPQIFGYRDAMLAALERGQQALKM
jgi:hypothetical protein